MPQYIFKSDLPLWESCPTKVYYSKSGYPTTDTLSSFQDYLTEGGHIVGKLAQVLFPEGVEVPSTYSFKDALDFTRDAMQQDTVTLFEAAFVSGQKGIRTDILKKEGNTIWLYEVKASVIDGQEGTAQFWGKRNRSLIISGWKPYLNDVTFQVIVLRELFPQATIHPFFILPDKHKTAQSDGFGQFFSIETVTDTSGRAREKVQVAASRERLANEDLLTIISIEEEVDFLCAEVTQTIHDISAALQEPLQRIETPISSHCKGCEFNPPASESEDPRNGFRECWGALADPRPHLFDLGNRASLDPLIASGRTSLFDIMPENLKKKDGTFGPTAIKQLIQIEFTHRNEEWFSPELHPFFDGLDYPLHFIDFETYQSAIPLFRGMRPYEKVAFQWSCHTIPSRDSTDLIHRDFLHTEMSFPNFRFAECLRETLGEQGTTFIWTPYENTILKEIYAQLDRFPEYLPPDHQSLAQWLESVTSIADGEHRFIDMAAWCKAHYYHPDMKASYSIKAVLPAIWRKSPWLRQMDWFKGYEKYDHGEPQSPYAALDQMLIGELNRSVKDGTEAIQAYQEMIFGVSRGDTTHVSRWERLLRAYCKLDTLAMVIIWTYWMKEAKQRANDFHPDEVTYPNARQRSILT